MPSFKNILNFLLETLAFCGYLLMSFIAPFILYLMGYQAKMPTLPERLLRSKRFIVIFSHTSYWDFFFFVLYSYTEPEFGSRVRVVMSNYFYRFAPWFLKRFGVIPAPSHDQQIASNRKPVGFVQVTTEALQNEKEFILILSPEGTLKKVPWRSGYYALAKNLQCPIVVGGMDYEKKFVYLSEVFDCIDYDAIDGQSDVQEPSYAILPREKLEPALQKVMEEIVALYPEYSFTPCHPKRVLDITLINVPHFVRICSLLAIAYTLLGYQTSALILVLSAANGRELYRLIRARAKASDCLDLGLALCYLIAVNMIRLSLA
jgi:1-acyl-sn-glycerol-3-phosphate acyltransferase